jgi:hypothetical protein
MHRIDESMYLLYIEPKKEEKSAEPVDDVYTIIMERAIECAVIGASRYSNVNDHNTFMPDSGFRGCHNTDCGERSTCRDYLLATGHITNSLAPFYLRWYRNSIPQSEMEKVKKVVNAYKVSYPE